MSDPSPELEEWNLPLIPGDGGGGGAAEGARGEAGGGGAVGRRRHRRAPRGGRKGGRDENRPAEGSDAEDDTAGNGLPMANLVRLMRQVIPTNARISARAKQLTHDCAVEFVGFVGGEASERAMAQHRRTIAPEDFTWSFRRLGLDNYVDPMSTYIRRYRDYQNDGGASSILAPRPPPRAAPGAPCFTDEEMQFLTSVVPSLHQGYDGAVSSSMHVLPPVAHGYGYTGYM